MTRSNVLLFASVVLNFCLIGGGARFLVARTKPGKFLDVSNGSRLTYSNQQGPGEAGHTAFNWSQLESTDYRAYIANLRAVGCPEETLRDIILAEINKLYAPKLAACRRAEGSRHYWQRPPPFSPDTYAQQRTLYKERGELIRALVGIDPEEENRKNDPKAQEQDDPLAFLPTPKRQSLRDLDEKYFNQERRIYSEANGLITPADRAALESLRQQKSAEMDTLLTPQERLEFQLRESPTARRLQQELVPFQPSEAEFRAICQAQIAFDERSQALGNSNPASPAPRSDDELQAQIETALGDQRYAEYQRSKDLDYQALVKVADRFGLSQDVAAQVLDMKQNAEVQQQQVLANTDLDASQKHAWLQALQDQVGTTLATLLGEKGFSAYHDYAGSWIDRLAK